MPSLAPGLPWENIHNMNLANLLGFASALCILGLLSLFIYSKKSGIQVFAIYRSGVPSGSGAPSGSGTWLTQDGSSSRPHLEDLGESFRNIRVDSVPNSATATPLVSEQENDFRPSYSGKRKSKNTARAHRRHVERTYDRDLACLTLLERMGFCVSDVSLTSLSRADIKTLAKKHTLHTKQASELHLKVTIIDLDEWVPRWLKKQGRTHSDDMFTSNKPVTEQDLIDHHFRFFTHGTIFAFKKVNGVDTLMFAAQFMPSESEAEGSASDTEAGETENGVHTGDSKTTPSAQLSATEKGYVSVLANWFYELANIGTAITVNAAHKAVGSHGRMIGQGWRAGTDKGYSMGLYKTLLAIGNGGINVEGEMTWELYQKKIRVISEIYNHFFGRLVPGVRDAARRFMEEHQLPVLGELTYEQRHMDHETLNKSAPASSLFVSHLNYATAVHRDHDFNPYTFGLWMTTRVQDRSVVTDPEEVSAHIKGGQC